MKHVAIDLEVSAKTPYAGLLAIGAAFFEPSTSEIGAKFRVNVDSKSALAAGGVADPETLEWWMKQSQAARDALAIPPPVDIRVALSMFRDFLWDNTTADDPRDTLVWGNGIRSDNVWLASAYENCGMDCPFGFWADSDIRTMVMLGRRAGIDPKRTMDFVGTPHNPLDDAIHQAKYTSAIWQKLLPGVSGESV